MKQEKINKIKAINKKNIVGTFKKNKDFGFVIPDNSKIGSDIFIAKRNMKNAKNGQKVVVQIIKFPKKEKNAEGKIIEILDNENEIEVDLLGIVKEYNLLYEFPKFVLDEVKKIPQEISKKDLTKRIDLRDKYIFTIDGEDAKDLDDAVCVDKLKNGNYILGVHIADVSYYVKENSKLDLEAILRGTSIYMFDRVIPMLPKKLSNGICSLNAGEDRFTISVEMEITPEGKIISSDIFKSVINVTERMSYSDVNKILDNSDSKITKKYQKYIKYFKIMEQLAKILQNKRIDQGYLNLNIPESKIILDKNGKVIDVKKYENSFSNEIIEQFMLTANEVVAEKFYWLDAPFIYRVHEMPDIEKIKELNKFLFSFGYKIKGNKEIIYPNAFSDIIEKIKGKPEEKIISTLILRTLKIARYESENKGHFGISSKYYCHFTSPIRRYPDLFIHRIISKYIEEGYNISQEDKKRYKELAKKYAETSSEKEKIAQKAERDSEDIKKAEFMEDKVGEIYNGIISNVTSFGIFIELENTIEGLIRFENLGNEYYIYDDEHKILIGESTKQIFKIGDNIKVQVIEANKNLKRVWFARVQEEEE